MQLDRGTTKKLLSQKTATSTSEPQVAKGHNAVRVHFRITAGTGAWTIKIQDSPAADIAFADAYDSSGNLMSTGSISANRSQVFFGVSEHFRVVATEDTDGATVDVYIETFTV